MKRSYMISLRSIIKRFSEVISIISGDRVPVYAAQASFFMVISSLPLIMLLLSLSRYVLSDKIYDVILSFGDSLPGGLKPLFVTLFDEMYARPAINLISVTALITLWSASKGIRAIRDGVATVYRAQVEKNFFRKILLSFLHTAIFIILLIALIILLLFGDQLFRLLSPKFTVVMRFYELFKYRTGIIFAVLVLFFALLYHTVGKHGEAVNGSVKSHLPGAFVAAGGWVLFSFFYSLYTLYFSRMSYIYGSLTAIILLMLWLYFCMIILLCGAEFNKYCEARKQRE